MKKKYFIYAILPIMVFAISGAVYTSVNASDFKSPMGNLVNALAQKFNLNVSDVQAVFDEQKAQMETEKEQKKYQGFADRLSQAVTDGKLTQEQADLITAKKAEIDAQRETQKTNMESMTQEERQTAIKEQMNYLKQWATDNNIPQEYLMFVEFGGRGGHGGPGGPGSPTPHAAKPCRDGRERERRLPGASAPLVPVAPGLPRPRDPR